ncbi:tetratricopeptide repeat protein, partial [Streptomyces benahoarensis]|uniref:tetratricopeptide repeat protein n=1 Tax=Streptomyces benahoarensis TaxID=2595054 RepID=UPI00163D46B2
MNEPSHRALPLFAEALDRYRALGDRAGQARALHSMGTAARHCGRYTQAEGHYAEALPLFRAFGDQRAVAHTLFNLGFTARHLGDHCTAGDHCRDALDGYRRLPHADDGQARTLHHLGHLAAALDQHAEARRWWEPARTAYENAELPQHADEITALLAEPPDEDPTVAPPSDRATGPRPP